MRHFIFSNFQIRFVISDLKNLCTMNFIESNSTFIFWTGFVEFVLLWDNLLNFFLIPQNLNTILISVIEHMEWLIPEVQSEVVVTALSLMPIDPDRAHERSVVSKVALQVSRDLCKLHPHQIPKN